MTVNWLPRLVLVCVCVGVGMILPLLSNIRTIGVMRPSSQSSSSSHRRLNILPEMFNDPRTIIVKEGGEELLATNLLYVVPETILAESKYVLPAIVHSRPPDYDHQGLVVDVLSVGSRTRPEYMTAQINTWASHPHVRNYWGINEEQDYDPHCDQMDNDSLQSYIQTCQGDMGWQSNNKLERFRQSHFGMASLKGIESRNAGWFCAQRRPGHGLGWLMEMYRDSSNIPDVLMIVDDDTAVDIENMKSAMQQHSDFVEGLPFIGSGCPYDLNIGFVFPFGGFGTFFNKAAIHQLTQPLYCYGNQQQQQTAENPDFIALSCAYLQNNTIGELDVYLNGDSALDLFYKYSATRQFCLHSDWALGYMTSHYAHKHISGLHPRRCQSQKCDSASISCHNQGPAEMELFVQQHSLATASSRR